MEVTVTRTDDGGYEVTLNERTITLPAGSTKKTQRNNLVRFGTPTNYIEVDVGPYEFSLVTNGAREVIVAEDESFDEGELTRRGDMYASLENAWRNAAKESPENPSGGLRLKKKTRRSKRHTRNHKGKKLRNLTTRRR